MNFLSDAREIDIVEIQSPLWNATAAFGIVFAFDVAPAGLDDASRAPPHHHLRFCPTTSQRTNAISMNTRTPAFGSPGIEPRWTRSDKEAIVTAYSASSKIWATLSAGIVNEVYFPSIDRPQIRDLQFLITDGETFFHDERRATDSQTTRLSADAPGYRVINCDREGRYKIEKQIITAPHAACLLVQAKVTVAEPYQDRIKLYALLAPHLNVGGRDNSGLVETVGERLLLTAYRGENHLAMDCSSGFVKASCGYVGTSDGWTDLAENMRMDWEFDSAPHGNIALMGEIDLARSTEFCLAVSFSRNRHGALAILAESLAIPFDDHLDRFEHQWDRACEGRQNALGKHSADNGRLLLNSHHLLLAHEDKTCHGAMIASLSIPWGEAKGDEDIGGYHLVWTRDMVNSATGLMASGETATPLRALIYLASSQMDDGGFYQNFWIDGHPYWRGTQLDEVAFPIILAWRLKQADALQQFDPYPMVKAAAGYLIRQGPATPQERWEENGGYSPSTLAAHIAGLVCASEFARERGDTSLAQYIAQYADFLRQHVERWTVTDDGTILPDVSRHFVRLLPIDLADPTCSEDLNAAEITIRNRASDVRSNFPAREVVDAGFLELVRYGIYPADDPLIVDSLKVIDEVLKVDTPNGPCWRRYSHDGYGQAADGGPFTGVGQGRAWPLLAGERAHYELAAGQDVTRFVQAIERFAGPTGLLPEQIWDQPDMPEARMWFGCPTGSAMPLMWAHAEYIKLLRSVHDGGVFDRIDAVHDRYCGEGHDQRAMEVWKFRRQPLTVKNDETLRIQAEAAFRLRWSADQWQTVNDTESTSPGLGIHFVDLPAEALTTDRVMFTFWWTQAEHWEGRNFSVEMLKQPASSSSGKPKATASAEKNRPMPAAAGS